MPTLMSDRWFQHSWTKLKVWERQVVILDKENIPPFALVDSTVTVISEKQEEEVEVEVVVEEEKETSLLASAKLTFYPSSSR